MANIYAVVTGASSGIGTELAKVLARQGYDLILVARRRDRLEKLRKYLSAKYGTDSVIIEERFPSGRHPPWRPFPLLFPEQIQD